MILPVLRFDLHVLIVVVGVGRLFRTRVVTTYGMTLLRCCCCVLTSPSPISVIPGKFTTVPLPVTVHYHFHTTPSHLSFPVIVTLLEVYLIVVVVDC